MNIPENIRKRIPLITEAMYHNYLRIRENANSPAYNKECGERLVQEDIAPIQQFREKLQEARNFPNQSLPQDILMWINSISGRSRYFRERLEIAGGLRKFENIQPMTKSTLRDYLPDICPEDENLDRLIVNPTSGTTGEPFMTPGHPVTSALYQPMILYALAQNGINLSLNAENTAAIQICAQKHTMTYCTVHTQEGGSGFAKINIEKGEWSRDNACQDYLVEMNPQFLSGDPYGYLRMAEMGLKVKTNALLSTAIELSPGVRSIVQAHFQAPIINFYSLNETGPVAYSCPKNPEKFHILPHDIYVEITDEKGNTLKEGDLGIITITGGRNPYLPLLRYQTGDYGRINYRECNCHGEAPILYDMQFRKLVIFRNNKNEWVNPVDISRSMKDIPIYAHRVFQERNGNIEMTIYSRVAFTIEHEALIRKNMSRIFGPGISMKLIHYRGYPDKKIIPFERENDF